MISGLVPATVTILALWGLLGFKGIYRLTLGSLHLIKYMSDCSILIGCFSWMTKSASFYWQPFEFVLLWWQILIQKVNSWSYGIHNSMSPLVQICSKKHIALGSSFQGILPQSDWILIYDLGFRWWVLVLRCIPQHEQKILFLPSLWYGGKNNSHLLQNRIPNWYKLKLVFPTPPWMVHKLRHANFFIRHRNLYQAG